MPDINSDLQSRLMPVLFVGHGSPMNALEDNTWSRGFRSLSALLPRPTAILVISAHWFVPGTFLTGNEHPRTIHDFGGFPDELYQMEYPAPGNPDLAVKVVRLVGGERADLSTDWGIDHGAWTVLHHLYPRADIPVVQLSLDSRLSPIRHLAIARALTSLRSEGVLIMGSGNIVHNLYYAMSAISQGDDSTPEWAMRFDTAVAEAVMDLDAQSLARLVDSRDGRMSHPTLDHYLPLIYAAGVCKSGDSVQFPITGFDMGSLSMRSLLFG